MKDKDTLYLGLCMAGAVSAGAYTAGVMDYLIEALEEWEKRRGQENVPTHKVIIPAIGGASAGGMTGIITAAAINNPITPITELNGDILEEQKKNKLYHTWVDLTNRDMFPELLNTNDINGDIYSLFNSNFIDKLSEEATKVDKSDFVMRPYFDKHLKVFTTLTNLKGFSYFVDFAGGNKSSAYYLTRHSDFAAFVLNKYDHEYNRDGWVPLDFFNDVNVEIAQKAAMATGAFPVGLRVRKLERKRQYLHDFLWHKDITDHWPLSDDPDDTLCVDGGMINNEPFLRVNDVLSEILQKETGDSITDEANPMMDTFDSTTILIDPFPSKPNKFAKSEKMVSVIGSTLVAMLAQMRMKPKSLNRAYNKNDPSQYLIAPSREIDNDKIEGERAIACGFFGGFGGFLHKEFRIHDFFLGRANCEQFLREHFTVPSDTSNPIFKNGYENVGNLEDFMSEDNRLQIIPLFKPKRKDGMYMPQFGHQHPQNWPIRKTEEIDVFQKDIKKRAGKIIMQIIKYNRIERVLMGIGNRLVLRRTIAKSTLKVIKKSMHEWKLIK